jgi:REP element-mobilizing transposase RayT
MPYWQLFYHLVWATKNRQPLLTPEIEPTVHGFLRTKAIGLEATLFALNGTADHVHMVVAIPPKIAIAKFVGQVKAVAATKFNKSGAVSVSFWQEEYGVFSFDDKRLLNYVGYDGLCCECLVEAGTRMSRVTPAAAEGSWYDADDLRWAARIGVRLRAVQVRAMTTKWASMSTAGRLTLNSELLDLPRSTGKYVIVPELVHLLAPSHGKVFKSFMSAFMPDWEEREKGLGYEKPAI